MKRIKIDSMAIKVEKFDHFSDVTDISDIIKGSIRDDIVIFQEILKRLLKKKDDEAKERIKTIDDEFNKLEGRIKKLETENMKIHAENMKLHTENMMLQTNNKKLQNYKKSKKKQPKCVECVDLERQLSDSRNSRTAEDLRMKKHIFKRQEKVKRYKLLLIEKDKEIMEKEESIVKYQEEIYAFEEKPKENDNHDEDPVSSEQGKEKDEKDEDLPIKEGEEKLVPIDELMSPSKDAEDNNRSTLHSQTNHSSLLDMVENAAKYYKSAISSDETREASEDKKHDSLELEETVYSF